MEEIFVNGDMKEGHKAIHSLLQLVPNLSARASLRNRNRNNRITASIEEGFPLFPFFTFPLINGHDMHGSAGKLQTLPFRAICQGDYPM